MRSNKRNNKQRSAAASRKQQGEPDWVHLSDEELLDVRLCDLGLKIEGTPLEQRIGQLYNELQQRSVVFRPHCWLSSEWFSPDDIPGIAIPFYLAHRRLEKLEDRMMLEVEGGTKTWCMQLLRHEVGHAIETAYRLGRRAQWRKLFGNPSKPYPDYYVPKPFSKRFVLHLDWWYAQSHPSEDFAETFAVWLRPGSKWRTHYKNWPALRKLQYVDDLMAQLGGRKPPINSRAKDEPLSRLRHTLREHYREKQARYGTDYPDFYDRDLRALFRTSGRHARKQTAAAFLRRIRPELRKSVAYWTGEHAYTIDQILKDMVTRCRQLDLCMDRPADELKLEAAILLTMQTTHYLHSTEHRIAV